MLKGTERATTRAKRVEAAVLQVVDRGFDRGMLAAERRVLLAEAVGPAEAPLPGQHVVLEQGCSRFAGLCDRSMRAAPGSAPAPPRSSARHVRVPAAPEDLVVEEEPVLVLQHADRNPEFHRTARLALLTIQRV